MKGRITHHANDINPPRRPDVDGEATGAGVCCTWSDTQQKYIHRLPDHGLLVEFLTLVGYPMLQIVSRGASEELGGVCGDVYLKRPAKYPWLDL